jgi:lipoprotein LprG
MLAMSRTLRAVAALSLLALVVSGCSKKDEPTPSPSSLPNGATLLTEAAVAMSAVKTAHISLNVDGDIENLSITKAEGDLTREGNAKGTATLSQSGLKVETEFVIVGQDAYLKGPTGGFTKVPLSFAATVYDPSAILDPARGLPNLLKVAKNPQTAAQEGNAYKVTFEPDATALAAIVPTKVTGIQAAVWVDASTKQITKGQFTVPASGGKPGGTITVVFSNFDAAVTVSAP